MSKIRHRRKKSDMPFADALAAATKRLAKATKERLSAQASLASLNAEIPNLQRTIGALQAQLKGEYVAHFDSKTGQQTAPVSGEVIVPGIPPELLATLPKDDLTGIGSTREDKFLPDAEGQELIPEK